MQEIGLREVLEQIDARLNAIEGRLNHLYGDKVDKGEIRLWFVLLPCFLGAILARLFGAG